MKRALLALAFGLAAGGCADRTCPNATSDSLDITGEPMPPGTAEVIALAQARCDRPIVGVIEFVNVSKDGKHLGMCAWGGGCPIDAWVVRSPPPGDLFDRPVAGWAPCVQASPGAPAGSAEGTAACTGLAHEIGHWCLQSADEVEVEAWAEQINEAAMSDGEQEPGPDAVGATAR